MHFLLQMTKKSKFKVNEPYVMDYVQKKRIQSIDEMLTPSNLREIISKHPTVKSKGLVGNEYACLKSALYNPSSKLRQELFKSKVY